jgi:hypothetical protein
MVIKSIKLKDERIFKISHSWLEAHEKQRNLLKEILEKKLIILNSNGIGFNVFKGLKKGDFVYVTNGGKGLICLGRISGELENISDYLKEKIEETETAATDEWFARKIDIISEPFEADVSEYKNEREREMPSGQAAFWEVQPERLDNINKKIFIKKFGVEFTTKDTTFFQEKPEKKPLKSGNGSSQFYNFRG